MQGYEALIVLRSNLAEADVKAKEKSVQEWITKNKGEIISFENWGKRYLNGSFVDHENGIYFQVRFRGVNETLDEFKRRMQVDEDFLRNMIVKLDSVLSKEAIAAL